MKSNMYFCNGLLLVESNDLFTLLHIRNESPLKYAPGYTKLTTGPVICSTLFKNKLLHATYFERPLNTYNRIMRFVLIYVNFFSISGHNQGHGISNLKCQTPKEIRNRNKQTNQKWENLECKYVSLENEGMIKKFKFK